MTATFKKDQRVTFTRPHDRASSLIGSVVEVKDDQVLVATDPDGVLVWAPQADVSVVEAAPVPEITETSEGQKKKRSA